MKRLSVVHDVYIKGVIFSSIVHIGDNMEIVARSRALAVQRELPRFKETEGSFAEYPFFRRPFPQPPINQLPAMSVDNLGSVIRVGFVNIFSLSSSGVLQIGSNHRIDAVSRIKHFRQFIMPKEQLPAFPVTAPLGPVGGTAGAGAAAGASLREGPEAGAGGGVD